jgi:hypothetical protein
MRARTVRPDSSERTVRGIRRATRRQYLAEEKIRIVLEGLRRVQNLSITEYAIPNGLLILLHS